MFTLLLFFLLLQTSLNFFSPESLVTMVFGGLTALGATQWLKRGISVQGAAATLAALAISLVVAVGAFVVSQAVNSGGGFSWATVPQNAAQIFALATVAYNLFLKDRT